jgi:hypothetical protein
MVAFVDGKCHISLDPGMCRNDGSVSFSLLPLNPTTLLTLNQELAQEGDRNQTPPLCMVS